MDDIHVLVMIKQLKEAVSINVIYTLIKLKKAVLPPLWTSPTPALCLEN